nr:pyruvate, water dikinase regulatory protein [Paenibacillus sp. 1001270B_150601_E10]
MMGNTSGMIIICSDSVGETAEAVVRAAISQFDAEHVRLKRYSHVRHADELVPLMKEAASEKGFIAYTLVQPDLREAIKELAIQFNVRIVDVMGPMISAFVDTFASEPKRTPGLLHQLDEDYFRRVEAIEFTVDSDDGKDLHAMHRADLILLGVSRTSKTPLSIYLAHKGRKVVNCPIVPEMLPPEPLFHLPVSKIIALTMTPEHLWKVRTERLKSMGLPEHSRYASMERIQEELDYASGLYDRLGCKVIDVTDKAIEETASLIMEWM